MIREFRMVSMPSEEELLELSKIPLKEPISREEERMIEGDERDQMVEAHLDTLDEKEREKVDSFVKQNATQKDGDMKPSLIR